MIKRYLLLLIATLYCATVAFLQKRIGYEKPDDQEKRLAWWTNDRLEMFIQWGLYALPVLVWPFEKRVLPGFNQKVKYVQFLHDNSEIKYLGSENQGSNELVLTLPVKKPLVEIPVIELTLR
ncbi:hypothetical protein [Chitinophaga ginsengisoli]|uniref:Uncharacterized protein n=1 Tax=Chitinophaga ginsengisoli TaxID=363837 RepID=A0A2P8FUZ8_9BACT|nr:hypothetical protein [Chitinophaga ginsengisoli]PSL25465.1 hypothetical protein CLV42_113147 [Chitinophaga ginsengisoli]